MAAEAPNNVNDILERIGNMKRYQLYLLFWSSVFYSSAALQTLVIVFTQADMDFRCSDSLEENYGGLQTGNDTIEEPPMGVCSLTNSSADCSTFTYTSPVFKSTIVSEFDLVCSKNIWPTLANMLFMFGRVPGGLLAGQLADRIGRRKTITIGLFLLGAFGLGTSYSVNLSMYIVLRFLSAMPVTAIYNGCATLLTEVVSPSKRAHVVIGLVYSWGVGISLLSLFAYFIRDWRTLHMAVSVPNFVLCPLAFWLFDESPHWLYSQGRGEEAQAVLEKIATRNGFGDKSVAEMQFREIKDTPTSDSDEKLESTLDPSDENSRNEQSQCGQMFRVRKFMAILLICAFGWLACDMGYAGLAIGSGLLPGNVYINNAIGGGVELVAYSIALLVIPGGRKKVYILLVAFGGLALIASALVNELLSDLTWLTIVTTMGGRLSVSASWQILYLWCIELFPTTVRATVLEASLMIGHVGSGVAPFINDLTKVIKDPNIHGSMIAPMVYGSLLIVSSILSINLPETKNKPLPANIEEAVSNIKSSRKRKILTTAL